MGGVFSSKKEMEFQAQLASVAIAVEALESILVEQGILREGQLQERIVQIYQRKLLQMSAFADKTENFWDFIPVKFDG